MAPMLRKVGHAGCARGLMCGTASANVNPGNRPVPTNAGSNKKTAESLES